MRNIIEFARHAVHDKLNIFLKKTSITKRLIIYFAFLLVVQMVFLGFCSYVVIASYLKNLYISRINELDNMTLKQINSIRRNYEGLSDTYLANPQLQLHLKKMSSLESTAPWIERNNLSEEIVQDLTDPVISTNDDDIGVMVVQNETVYQSNSGGLRLVNFSQIKDSAAYKKALESSGENLWTASVLNLITQTNEPYLYECRTLNSLDINSIQLGQLIIQIPMSKLDSVFNHSNLSDGEYYSIIDDGYCIYNTADMNKVGEKADGNELSLLNSSKKYMTFRSGDQKFIFFSATSDNGGWSIIHVLPMRIIMSCAGTAMDIVLVITLLPLLIAFPLLILLSRSISNPIIQLKSVMEQFGVGKLDVRSETDRSDEIGHLQISFNKMAEDINKLLQKNAEENRLRRRMELNILEYQINPHFLYNSLDSINWMAQRSGSKDIEELVNALAKFFRLSLSKGREFYRVRDELEHVRQYLLINRIRLKDCFHFEIQADPEILECATLRIILQPIAENAIKYGIDKKDGNGLIRISAQKIKNHIVFEVSDNGKGILPERLSVIQEVLKKHHPIDMDSGGFGLFNVNQRLWMQYGDGYGVSLQSGATGTTVQLRIPVTPS